MVSFGLSNQMVVTFKEENLMTFKHLFLKDYVDGRGDSYAVYRQDEVYEHISYIVDKVRPVNSCYHILSNINCDWKLMIYRDTSSVLPLVSN